MSTEANTLSSAAWESATPAARTVTAGQRFLWSVRRELWEYRSIFIGLLSVASLCVLAFLIGLLRLGTLAMQYRDNGSVHTFDLNQLTTGPYILAVAVLMGTSLLITGFYCLGALSNERGDRSSLFWRSLPVSDLTAVGSKAAVAIVVIPAITLLVILGTVLLMLLAHSFVLLLHGQNALALWNRFSLVQLPLVVLYHLVTAHVLWYAPLCAWLLLAGAWARRMPFLWAVLVPLAAAVVEKIAFGSTHILAVLASRFDGGSLPGPSVADPLAELHPGAFFAAPGLWLGLLAAAVFLAAAVQLRRFRGPL